ncbi:MAG: HAD family hydrolase [Streptococcaceae bacterium]|jgi:Cof subfamily protein (haloacid dehalogenase superfamily)|nr:HAD family hydrolase [Streptococcaceae bacterium]
MTDFKKMYIACDLDGTLVGDGAYELLPETKVVFDAVRAKGHEIILCTGRPYRMAIGIYQELGLTSPMVTFNGSLTSLPGDKNWKYTHKRFIPKDFVFDLVRHQQTFDLEFVAAEYRRKFYLNNFQGVDPWVFGVEKFEAYNRMRLDRLTTDPHSVLLSTRVKDKISLAKEMQAHFGGEITVSAWGGPNGILEVVPRGVNKAYALEHLIKAMGIAREQLIAFGDEYNDVEMFQLAQTGYAVKNASERLIGHADEILPWTNMEGAVPKKLRELFL